MGHDEKVLTAIFVRRRGRKDHVYVVRSDGSTADWELPSYGDGLPHDLCHLVVEEGLGLVDGFWDLVDRHVEVRLVDNQATLVRHGIPLSHLPGFDLSGLTAAEEAVALLASPAMTLRGQGHLAVARLSTAPADHASEDPTPDDFGSVLGFRLPTGTTDETVTVIRERLQELGRQWRALDDAGSITVTFAGPA